MEDGRALPLSTPVLQEVDGVMYVFGFVPADSVKLLNILDFPKHYIVIVMITFLAMQSVCGWTLKYRRT